MAFATLFRFVVWTVSCLYDLPVQSLHVLSIESFARDCHATKAAEVSPNLSSSTKEQSQLTPRQPNQFLPSPKKLRRKLAKSAALTKHELEALKSKQTKILLH